MLIWLKFVHFLSLNTCSVQYLPENDIFCVSRTDPRQSPGLNIYWVCANLPWMSSPKKIKHLVVTGSSGIVPVKPLSPAPWRRNKLELSVICSCCYAGLNCCLMCNADGNSSLVWMGWKQGAVRSSIQSKALAGLVYQRTTKFKWKKC